MKILTILLLISFSVSAQTNVIYRATGNDTVDVSVFNNTDTPKFVYLESSDSLFINGLMADNSFAEFKVILTNNEVIKGRAESGVTYTISKPFTPVRDSTLIRFQTVLQSLDGFNLGSSTLSNAQIRALFGVLLRKEGALTPDGTIRIKKLLKD